MRVDHPDVRELQASPKWYVRLWQSFLSVGSLVPTRRLSEEQILPPLPDRDRCWQADLEAIGSDMEVVRADMAQALAAFQKRDYNTPPSNPGERHGNPS